MKQKDEKKAIKHTANEIKKEEQAKIKELNDTCCKALLKSSITSLPVQFESFHVLLKKLLPLVMTMQSS